jgi:hypothetical protein
MARRADGVEAAVRLLELSRGNVDLPRCELIFEQAHRRSGGQVRPRTERRTRLQPVLGRFGVLEIVVELSLDDGDAIPGHAAGGSAN